MGYEDTALFTEGKMHKCEQISKAYYLPFRLELHICAKHTMVKPYKCIECNKAFAVKANLKRHVLIHSGIKPHICEECKQSFIQFVTLRKAHKEM